MASGSLLAIIFLNAAIAYSAFPLFLMGRLSIATVGLMEIGAYTSIYCTTRGWPLFLSLLVSAGVCAVVGAALGLVLLRVRAVFFAIATLAFSVIVMGLAPLWTSLTGGALGTQGIPADTSRTDVVVFCLVIILLARAVSGTRVGRALRSIGADERVASTVGINVRSYVYVSFILSGIVAGVGGGLFANEFFAIDSTYFTFAMSLNFIAYAFVGGIRSSLGALLGSAILVGIPTELAFSPNFENVVTGVVLALIALFMPNGLADGRLWRKVGAATLSLVRSEGRGVLDAGPSGSADGALAPVRSGPPA